MGGYRGARVCLRGSGDFISTVSTPFQAAARDLPSPNVTNVSTTCSVILGGHTGGRRATTALHPEISTTA